MFARLTIMKIRVWIFEDDPVVRMILTEIAIIAGYEVRSFPSPYEIGDPFNPRSLADIVITDIRMPNMTGIELSSCLIQSGFDPKNIAILSGLWTEEHSEFARQFRIQTFTKPISAATLMEWLQTRKVRLSTDRIPDSVR